jgi:hypothetical protein
MDPNFINIILNEKLNTTTPHAQQLRGAQPIGVSKQFKIPTVSIVKNQIKAIEILVTK